MTLANPSAAAARRRRRDQPGRYCDIIVRQSLADRRLTALALAMGGAYAFWRKPVYESNLLIQVEDTAGAAKSFWARRAACST